MIKISIVCVGKIKEKFFRDAKEEYSKRFLPKNLRHGLKIALSEEKAISALSLADRLVCIQVSVKERIWP